MSLKSAIKKILPPPVKRSIGSLIVRRRERRIGRLSLREAFDAVYEQGMWKQGNTSSGIGSEGRMAERYVDLVSQYAFEHKLRTAVDAGCGDFSVGSRLAGKFERYMAFDVSPIITEINKKRYAEFARKNVSFGVADMTLTTFPQADLILIRQVLQHLTNAQIEQILRNLEASKWRRVLITEEVHEPRNNCLPNLDLPSHTVRTRVSRGSGVFIDQPPFSRPAKRLAVIDSDEPQAGLLVFELSRENSK